MMSSMLQALGKAYPLKELDCGEFAVMKHSGMTFHISAYEAGGLGHVSVMKASGFFGLMKMDTLMVVPLHRDMPLLSYDRVHAMGNDTLIFELYDTFQQPQPLEELEQVKEKYAGLPEHDLGAHWYDSIKLPQSLSKKGKKVHRAGFDACVRDYIQAFLACCTQAPESGEEAKREKSSVYVEGLLANGGPSTDVFIKGIGKEKTQALFRKILFATQK